MVQRCIPSRHRKLVFMKNILLVNDTLENSQFIKQVFNEINKSVTITEASGAENAMNYMNKNTPEKNQFIPDLIIIDIISSCIKLLEMIKSNDTFRRIPVIILCSSYDAAYTNNCYSHFANAVIIKPTEKEKLDRKSVV